MLDFRVNTFLKVCDCGNYTKAAEKLNLTQPAVTQHIRFIEEKYEVKLFKKDGKSMKLTDAGKALRDMFLTLRADEKKMYARIKALDKKPMPIIMGASKSIGEYVLPDIIKKYLDKNPSASFLMEVENTASLIKKLKSGELEFLIVDGKFDKNSYWNKLFSRENLLCLCSPESAFADKTVDINELFNQRIIIRENGSGTRDIFEYNLAELGYSLSNFVSVTEIGSPNTIKNLVADNFGITFMYEAAASAELKAGSLKKIDIRGFNTSHEFNFICLKDSMFLEDFEQFFNFASENRCVC